MKSLSTLKIFFMGTPLFAEKILANLLEKGISVSVVFTQPDRPMGRKKELVPSAVKLLAEANKIPIKQFERFDEQALEFFADNVPDLIIVAAYGLILPKSIIDLPAYGCINIHASLLPDLRGPSPIQTALLHGYTQTGTTIMLMDEKMDQGDILAQSEIFIEKTDNYNSLQDKLIVASNSLLIETLEDLINNKIKPIPQNHTTATYTKIISKQDAKVMWTQPAEDIYHQYQAFYRWPKIFSLWSQEKELAQKPLASKTTLKTPTFHKQDLKKIIFHEIDYSKRNDSIFREIGQVFTTDEGKIAIQTTEGLIFPKIIQLEGKNPVDIENFVNGYPQFISAILE